MIHVADERLVRLIVLGKKTTHRFPANRKVNTGQVTHPKIVAGKVHRVYTEAPFGRDGNPDAKPLVEVMVDSVESDTLGSITDEEARLEGFASVEAYATYWDRAYYHKALLFHRHQYHPVWIVSFTYRKTLPAGKELITRLEQAS
jgi:hypothetical protein